MPPYSALFSTRFFSDLIESGAEWNITTHHEINKLCNYQSIIIPIMLKTRFRVPYKKIWEYSSDAMNITCKEYKREDTRGVLNYSRILKDVRVNISDHSDFTSKIGDNVMKFTMTCHSVNMTQTYERIEIKDIDKSENSCLRGFINFTQPGNKDLDSALRIAVKRKFVRSDQISHWKILVAYLLDEFQDPTNRYIRNVQIFKRVEVYLNERGQKLTCVFLFVAIIIIWSDRFIPNFFLDCIDFIQSIVMDVFDRFRVDIPRRFGYQRINN